MLAYKGYGQDTPETRNSRVPLTLSGLRPRPAPLYSSTGSRSTALLRSSAVGRV